MTLLLANGTREIFDPTSLVEDYLDAGRPRRHRFSWPYYDGLVTNGVPDELVSGDFLAPVLLGAEVSLDAMASLVSMQPRLHDALADVPSDVADLADADDATCVRIAAIWAVLDAHDTADVKGSLIAKVMHRKRPGLIPVYDSRVFHFYQDERCIPPARRGARSWEEYMGQLIVVMREDLRTNRSAFADLVTLAPPDGPPLTPLRALDIVVWMSQAAEA